MYWSRVIDVDRSRRLRSPLIEGRAGRNRLAVIRYTVGLIDWTGSDLAEAWPEVMKSLKSKAVRSKLLLTVSRSSLNDTYDSENR